MSQNGRIPLQQASTALAVWATAGAVTCFEPSQILSGHRKITADAA